MVAYCGVYILDIQISSFHNIIVGIVVGLICFLIGNSMGKPTEEKTARIFFPEKFND